MREYCTFVLEIVGGDVRFRFQAWLFYLVDLAQEWPVEGEVEVWVGDVVD